MTYEDKVLNCRECGKDFVFTAGEQEFFALKGLQNDPARCPTCRARRRQERSGPRPMTTVRCANCGGEAQVPFVPRGDKPVYCSRCFEQMRAEH